ncbi:ribonuclease E/G [Novosphingopyxis sp.]|uniref:ribonuclease E/G n=1 Tax=Novosphingopyxis sp. TaxID=2709690 RepID=UPI003B5AC9B2
MAEWLYENGIGEVRALKLDDGRPVAIRIERPSAARAGAVIEDARLVKLLGGRGLIETSGGLQGLLSPIPQGLGEGQMVTVEITREAGAERGRFKELLARPSDKSCGQGPTLRERIAADGPVRELRAAGAETLDDHGWNDWIEQARQGLWPFAGGSLRIEITSAFVAIDVDGDLPPRDLALAAAPEVARAIAMFDLQGNIAVDCPTLATKADRVKLAELFDAATTFDCERTAVNGFGLLQVIRRRTRASTLETLQGNAVASAALELLRRGERSNGRGQLTLRAHPAVVKRLEKGFAMVEELAARIGRPVAMESDPSRPIRGGEAINEVEA